MATQRPTGASRPGRRNPNTRPSQAEESEPMQPPLHDPSYYEDFIEVGSAREKEEIAQLQTDLNGVDKDYVTYVRRNAKIDAKLRSKRGEQLDKMNLFYNKQVLLLCSRPLLNGVNARSIARSIGMYWGACIASKNFRTMIRQHKQAKKDAKLQRVSDRLDKWAKKAGEDSAFAKARDHFDKLVNGGRVPWNPRSAALTQLGMAQKAYHDMRVPGANVEQIQADYHEAMVDLYHRAEGDGVSPDEIRRNLKTIVGEIGEHDPGVYKYFSETAFGAVKRDGYRTVVSTEMTDTGPVEHRFRVWEGEFVDSKGEPYLGDFHVRPPSSEETYAEAVAQQFYADIRHTDNAFEIFDRQSDLHHTEWVTWQDAMADDLQCDVDYSAAVISDSMQTAFKLWMLDSPEHEASAREYMAQRSRWTAEQRAAERQRHADVSARYREGRRPEFIATDTGWHSYNGNVDIFVEPEDIEDDDSYGL